jgi:hypothetical protein
MDLVIADNQLDGYFQLNEGLYSQEIEGELFSSRYIANGVTMQVLKWNKDFPILESFGYPSQKKRLARLKRNYFEQVSHDQANALFHRKFGNSVYTGAPLSYTTNKIKQSGNLGCIVGGSLSWKAARGISESVKVLPGDLVFLDRCIQYAVPPAMLLNLGEVRLHFAGCFVVPAFFPQLIAMRYQHERDQRFSLRSGSFGKSCFRALEQACDYTYRSKWKPQIRILNFFRRTVKEEDFEKILAGVSLV